MSLEEPGREASEGHRPFAWFSLALLMALFFSLGLAKALAESGVVAPRTNLDVLDLFHRVPRARRGALNRARLR